MKFKVFMLVLLFTTPLLVHAENGLIKRQSHFNVDTTTDRLEKVLKEKGMTIFARINHTDAANKVGIVIRPTELLIFGNPKVGSPLMACQQSIAIDLPQKALISQDENNVVWLTYNDPHYLADRHQLQGCEKGLQKVEKALTNFSKYATQP
ncbi:hypothetical protein GCM10007916_24890 [Psychromonas marina]|uniref:DUF302 domain-containing protein n=1 Tax=Psychromonas marina TaxID=88364 RepID=A0ABQ6E274_9GAMM|nr:DUF302 domain-containing protein [Psychromonas marina]GLS91420.1 hypothetical protein GCM10007916_24890 [Psychromonas marina]